MTKKDFKEQCYFTSYDKGKNKRNAIFFDWKSEHVDGKWAVGYKYMVKASVQNLSKTELFNELYNWVTGKIQAVTYWADYKYAKTDAERFKIPLAG